ncbi:MAG: aminomethyltransferase [Candidatus Pelagibacter sp. TMED166]|nr:MAG: aminomethyltransferase [Candidatus Pelagibacter sp. TMED166]|tara:strand:- start:91 stop:981 length:891 start_codon:yes stop_codon:yes gene_type:complete
MNIKKVYILEDRGILFINGDDSIEFIQNLITNDINKVTDTNSCYASLLSPQGKYLFDFIIIRHKNGFIIDCEKDQVNNLLKQLNLYKLRSKVEVLDLSNEFVVAAISLEKYNSFPNSKEILGYTFKYREDPVILDPRHKNLGGRILINLEKLHLSLKILELKSATLDEYYQISYELGIPQKNTGKLQNKLFGIECNFEELNCLDFKKGCYVGQENTSRIKIKNKLNKRLLPIELIKGSIKDGDIILSKNNEIGKVLISEKYSFGLIKVKDKDFDFNEVYKSGTADIKILRPNWLNL